MDATQLERDLGLLSEETLRRLIECWKTKQGAPSRIVYEVLVDVYRRGVEHKDRDGMAPVPRAVPGSWSNAATYFGPVKGADWAKPIQYLTELPEPEAEIKV